MIFGEEITVPLHYSPREKFIEFIQVKTDYDNTLDTDTTLPRLGFELTSMDYDSLRMLNPMSRMTHIDDSSEKYMFNRIPYNFAFTVYLGTVKFEDSLKIIEQIVPFFTPELNITVKDKEDFNISTDIPVVLNNVGFSIDWQGSFETRRTILWELSFTAKAFLYSNVREQQRIKETIVNMTNQDFNKVYETLTSVVEPRKAEKHDSHRIIDHIYNGLPPQNLEFNFSTGESLIPNYHDNDENYSIMNLRIANSGEFSRIISIENSL